MYNKNFLIAGGSGLVGANLTKRLSSLGVNFLSTFFSYKPNFLIEKYRCFDFTKSEDCLEATRYMDYVILCAGKTSGIGGRNSKHIIDNLKININLLEACYINKVEKVIFISSSTVYQQANYPICEDELDLNKPPYDCYRDVGWLNRYVEQLCKYYFKDHGMKIGIVRPTNLYGPYDKFDDERSHILPALIKRALRKENPFVVWGDGEVIRDFVYVHDFIDDLFGIFEKKCDCDPINIGSNKATTVKAAANIILNLCGHDSVTPQFDLSKPTAIPYRMLNVDKLAMTFGNRKRTSLEEGLSKTIRWYEHLPNS